MKRIILFITLMLMALPSMAQYYNHSTPIPEELLAPDFDYHSDYYGNYYGDYYSDYYSEIEEQYETYRDILIVVSILHIVGTIIIVVAYFRLCRNVKEILYHMRRRDGVRWSDGYFSPCRDDGTIIKSEE